MRVMKSRKQLSHLDLQTECIRQLSNYFKPDMKVIKKRIEDLIQRLGVGVSLGWEPFRDTVPSTLHQCWGLTERVC